MYTDFMLSTENKKEFKEMIFEGVFEALEQVVMPRFHNIEERIEIIAEDVSTMKEDIGTVKEDVGGLKSSVEILDNDMGGVKMRLSAIEKKLDDRTDTFLVVKNHERRIAKLEKTAI